MNCFISIYCIMYLIDFDLNLNETYGWWGIHSFFVLRFFCVVVSIRWWSQSWHSVVATQTGNWNGVAHGKSYHYRRQMNFTINTSASSPRRMSRRLFLTCTSRLVLKWALRIKNFCFLLRAWHLKCTLWPKYKDGYRYEFIHTNKMPP